MITKKTEQNGSFVPSTLRPSSGQTNSGQGLRKWAEEKADARRNEDREAFWPEEARHLLHELEVHQIELEMQNEELRRTQQELETSQGRYFDLYNLAPVGYCTLSQKGLIVETNNTFGNLTGYAINQLIGSPFSNFIDRDSQDDYYLYLRNLLKKKRAQTCELKLLRKDAPSFQARLYSIAREGGDDQSLEIRIAITDITKFSQLQEALQQSHHELEERVKERTRELSRVNKRLRTEIEDHQQSLKALRESEEKYRSLVESTDDSIYMVDEEGRYLFINKKHQTRLGLPSSGNVEVTYRMFHTKKETDLFKGKIGKVVATRLSQTYEYHSGRDEHYFIRTLSPVKNDTKVTAVLVTSKDITLQRQAEENSARLRKELAHLGRLTTMGELTASLAHELNQPLTAVLSNAQTARRFLVGGSPDFAMLHDILDDIVADNKRASEIIQRLRAMVRREDLRITTLDIRNIVHEVISILKRDAGIRRFIIEENMEGILPPVVGDKIQVQQVILNLILNGADALMDVDDPERRKIVISAGRENAGWVRISVRDFGRGIDADNLETIFSPFFTTKEKGMGMGLTICRTSIKALGGKIWAENDPDRGAVIHFTLPMADPRG